MKLIILQKHFLFWPTLILKLVLSMFPKGTQTTLHRRCFGKLVAESKKGEKNSLRQGTNENKSTLLRLILGCGAQCHAHNVGHYTSRSAQLGKTELKL